MIIFLRDSHIMVKFYKIGFWILLLSITLMINYIRTYQINCEDDVKDNQIRTKKRENNLFESNSIIMREITSFNAQDIISLINNTNILDGRSVIILLDQFKCNKCQEKELIRLKSLKHKFEMKGINVLGITTFQQRDNLIRQRKIAKINFPIYMVDEIIFKKIAFSKMDFPQVIYIDNGIILSGFLPISTDEKFSQDYYESILTKIE